MITPLITSADIAIYKSISANIDFDMKVKPAVQEAQEVDIKNLVGEEFWIAIKADAPLFATYDDLWNAKVYEYQGITYEHQGLKAVLVYYAYSRYKQSANQHDTAYGVVVKENPYSTPADSKEISQEAKNSIAIAEAYWRDVEKYLDRFSSSYPLWRFCASQKKLTGNGVKIRSTHSNNDRSCYRARRQY